VGIDYVVDLDCPVKQALPTEKLVELIKGRNQIAAIVDMARRSGDQRPPEELSFVRMVSRPEGTVKESVKVSSLLERVQVLKTPEHHCPGCKANRVNQPFGCYGSISYPITVPAEQWLMALLPDSLDSAAGLVLRRAVSDFKYDGGMFLKMRPQDTFFESRTPVKRQWGSWLSSWTLTSDQLLQMLFGLGPLQPSHCKLMSIILGLITTDDRQRDPPPARSTDQSMQMADAVNAMGLAGQLEVQLLVDA
jgi:hypothetical protein